MYTVIVVALLLFALSLAYRWGVTASRKVEAQSGEKLHSRYSYYGITVALWCAIPARVVFILYLFFEPVIADAILASYLPPSVSTDPSAAAAGLARMHAIASGFAGSGEVSTWQLEGAKALARIGQDHASPVSLVETVIKVNEDVKRRMIEKLMDLCSGSFNGKRVAVLGVTFKPNTDDMRDAPSLTIVPALIGGGAEVRVCDPQGRREGEHLLPGVSWYEDPYSAAAEADLVVFLTEWNEFRALDLPRMAQGMRGRRMADLRNIYSADAAREAGFTAYDSIGRSGFSE